MDTRNKIVDAVPADASFLKMIVGYFDPMHAGHIRRLRELCEDGARIGVIVADPAEPILATRARAELVAGLEFVSYVIPAGKIVPEFPDMIDERGADAGRARTFAQHVLARHNTK